MGASLFSVDISYGCAIVVLLVATNNIATNKRREATMETRNNYWKKVELKRGSDGRLPSTAFDFVGLHKTNFSSAYSLSAPLCLCPAGNRPKWETLTWKTKAEATQEARKIAKQHQVRVIDCCN
jgi:hypothetical protein